MPYYEVTVTKSKPVCVEASCESEAIDKATDELMGDWNRIEAEIEDEFDITKPDEARFVAEYKQSREFYRA